MGRKHCWKRRNCSLRAISSFPAVFSIVLYCRHVKTRACLGKGFNITWGYRLQPNWKHCPFSAHLSTMCSRGAFRVTLCLSSVNRHASPVMCHYQFFKNLLLLNPRANLDQTWLDIPWEIVFKDCSSNLIPSKTLVESSSLEPLVRF